MTQSTRTTRTLAWVPQAGVVLFVVLYFVSALLYPGGTRAEPNRVGFSFLQNYWCDVLDSVTYGGRPNPAAPVALGATILLALGLSSLWWTIPILYPKAKIRGWLVRAAGVVSGGITPLIATKHHDLVINIAALSGAFAFIVSSAAIGLREGRTLAALSAAALAAATLNYVCWGTGFALAFLPLIQKFAFAFLLAWAFLVSRHALAAMR